MAKKIRTFADYDAARQERELNLPQAIESKLEQMVLLNIRKNEKELSLGVRVLEIMAHPLEIAKALSEGPKEIMRLYLEKQTERLNPQAEREATLDYFQQNMYELIVCGVSISKPYGALNDDQKQSFYARFLDNVKEFTDSKHFAHFKIRYSEIENLVRSFHPPEKEDELHIVTKITDGLCREKYITRENADTIVRLLSPRQEVQAFPIRPSPARGKTPPPVSQHIVTRSKSTKEERLEYLTVLFNLDVEPATHIADNATLEQLEEMQSEMKNMLGENYFLKMVTINPAILLYPAENVFTKYHRTLSLVVGRIKRNGDRRILEQRFGVESNLERYASLEKLTQLKQELLTTTGEYAPAPMQTEAVFDLEEYKDKLLMKAEMNVPVVRAYTHGKTALFKGEYYIPREYFRKNATGKVPANILDNNWEDVFNEMVRLKAITKKPKDASPLYRLNPHINEIINPYLREYMRVTLYAAQIIAQEEKITPQFQQSQL